MSDIQRADPRARRAALLILVSATVAGGLILAIVTARRSDLEAWVLQDVTGRARVLAWGLTVLTAGPLAGMAVYYWRLGGRVVRARRFPLPGARVVRDTPVLIGDAARQRGRLAQICAVGFGAAGVLFVVFFWRLISALEHRL